MVTFKINGREVEAAEGSYILAAARDLGLDIPALCDYISLESHGACRLCIVEVAHPNWPGWRKLVTSCNYPVSEGLEVSTNSPTVKEHRAELFRLLLARCPESEYVQKLARRYSGVTETPYTLRPEPTECILCDMCVRVCEERSTSALAHAGRGIEREVNPPTDECVGCGACALICPAQCIPFERGNLRTAIWGREFPVAYCAVDPDKCRACGLCEERCYFDVARVKLFANGRLTSFIDKDVCQGCGSCIAVCPAGAISMPEYDEIDMLARIRELAGSGARVVAFACPRSPIPAEIAGNVIVLPCIGRVSMAMMMAAVLAGARKVMLMGRDADSCHFSEGERQAEKRVEHALDLLRLMRLGDGRIQVVSAPPGLRGPEHELERIFAENNPASIFETLPPVELTDAGYDELAAKLRILCGATYAPDLGAWAEGLGAVPGAETALYVNRIVVLDYLAASLMGELSMRGIAKCALKAMGMKGVSSSIVSGRAGCGSDGSALDADVEDLIASGAKRILTLCPESAKNLNKRLPDKEVLSLDEYMQKLAKDAPPPEHPVKVAHSPGIVLPALPGVEWIPLKAGMHAHGPFLFRLPAEERKAYSSALVEATQLGAQFILCHCPAEYLQVKLLLREGAWRMSRVEPVTPASLACILLGGGKDEQ
jgi:bidirectional [NiFe] hydrogenase diaphorase subunit